MKIAVLTPELKHRKNSNPKNKHRNLKYFGLHMVINEIKKKWDIDVAWCSIVEVNQFDVILVSIHSVEDIYNLIYTIDKFMPAGNLSAWVAGGAGIANIKILSHFFDYISLGRGEISIHEILNHIQFNHPINNNFIWVRNLHSVDKALNIRYAQKLYPDSVENRKETMYGCKYNCFYCRYRYSSLPPTKRINDIKTTMPGNEETFWELEIKSGTFYTTSLDGLTEKTRFKVNKPITNKQVIDKLVNVAPIKSHINLKIYMIVGYPNEQEINLNELREISQAVDSSKSPNKFMLKIYITPFTPEPTTPMQWCPLNLKINYKKEFVRQLGSKLKIYNTPKVRMQINQAINSPFTLVKRAILNRGYESDIELVRYLIQNPKINNHNINNTDKLILLQDHIDLTKFTKAYKIGESLPTSNIKSWESDSNIIRMATKVHKVFNL